MSAGTNTRTIDWKQILCVDLRALGLFRIGLGSVLLFDLVTRAADWTAHYTDAGILPADLARSLGGRSALLSLHLHASAEPAAVAALLGIGMLAALSLILGWNTRVASVLSWVLLMSLQLRNPYVSRFGGDNFFLLLLFWGMFLPLGARYSLDARRRREADVDPGNVLFSVPGAALLIQTFLLYFVTGWVKQGPTWQTGSALFYALHLDAYVTDFGVFVREQSRLLPALTFLALWFERLAPFVPFVPFHNAVFRMLGIFLFVGLHVSIAAMLWVGWFPAFCLAAWPAFLPSALFDEWLPRLRGLAPRPAATRARSQPWWVQAAAGTCLAYVLVYLVAEGGPWPTGTNIPPSLKTVAGKALRLHQRWSMFSPDPPELDGWPRIEGVLADGSRRDLLTGEPFDPRKPERVIDTYPSFRWAQFFESTWEDSSKPSTLALYREYARWLCESAAADEPALERVRIHHAAELTTPAGPRQKELHLMTERSCSVRAASGARVAD
ncbi:MAG: HTTM domain-containing protein [Myxococcota bacterium]|nr:HTTM domain-containing protein [Myxococcota bacterium]